jgi:hypothetical protein
MTQLLRISFEDWRATYVEGSLDPIVHQIFSEPMTQRMEIQQPPWTGESQFKVRKVHRDQHLQPTLR